MVKCKKHDLFVAGCTRWNGTYLSEVCEKCDFKGRELNSRSDTTEQEKTVRRNSYSPIENKGNIVKKASVLKVQSYFEGGSHGEQA